MPSTTDISPLSITDGKISNEARIAHAKLAKATEGQILVAQPNGKFAAKTLAGDVTLTADGSTTSNVAVSADGTTVVTGATGAKGDTGSTGSQGATGATGGAGADGSDGSDGADGTNGTNGTDGSDGTDGTDGSDATVTATNVDGALGFTGSTAGLVKRTADNTFSLDTATYSATGHTHAHADLTSIDTDQHIDWTASSAGTIDASNYTNTTYSEGNSGLVPAEGSAGQFLKYDASWGTPVDTNTTYSDATTSTAGLMSGTDKTKLDGIDSSANDYSHPAGAGNNHIPTGGASSKFLKWSSSGVATWEYDNFGVFSITAGNGLLGGTITSLGTFSVNMSSAVDSTSIIVVANSAAVKTAYDRSWPNTTYSVEDGGLTQKNFTSDLKTKLDGVAIGATSTTINDASALTTEVWSASKIISYLVTFYATLSHTHKYTASILWEGEANAINEAGWSKSSTSGAWGASQSHSAFAQTSTTGSGTGALFSVVTDSGGIPTFTWVSGGTGYAISDTLTFTDPYLTGEVCVLYVSGVHLGADGVSFSGTTGSMVCNLNHDLDTEYVVVAVRDENKESEDVGFVSLTTVVDANNVKLEYSVSAGDYPGEGTERYVTIIG